MYHMSSIRIITIPRVLQRFHQTTINIHLYNEYYTQGLTEESSVANSATQIKIVFALFYSILFYILCIQPQSKMLVFQSFRSRSMTLKEPGTLTSAAVRCFLSISESTERRRVRKSVSRDGAVEITKHSLGNSTTDLNCYVKRFEALYKLAKNTMWQPSSSTHY